MGGAIRRRHQRIQKLHTCPRPICCTSCPWHGALIS
jgi:hypothetical protein